MNASVCLCARVRWKTHTPPASSRLEEEKTKSNGTLIELLYAARMNVAADADPWLFSKVPPPLPLPSYRMISTAPVQLDQYRPAPTESHECNTLHRTVEKKLVLGRLPK